MSQASSAVTSFRRASTPSATFGRPSAKRSPCHSGVNSIRFSFEKSPSCPRPGMDAKSTNTATPTTAFFMSLALFQTLGGRLADRFGPRRVLTMGVIWWGVFTAMTAAVPASISRALILFIAIRFLLGVGEAVVYPASNQFVARWIPSQERGIANGWIFAGVGAGAGLSPPLITFLMLHYGWRTSFWVCAVLGLIVGAVWFLTARDSP